MMDFLTQLDWRAPAWGWLALTPLLLAAFARLRRQRLAAYADAHLLPWAVASRGAARRSYLRGAAWWFAWGLLTLAATGPRVALESNPSDEARPEARHHLTLLVALDISASMAATDIAPERLARARLELTDLLARLRGERVGVVVFAGQAGLLLPPSDDLALVADALAQAGPDLIEPPGTNLAAALEVAGATRDAPLSLERGAGGEGIRHAAVLLVTDGEADSLAGPAGEAARQAAEKLRAAGVPLFVLGVGSELGAPIPLPDGGFAQRDGEQVLSRPDAAALQALARATGGRFERARDGDADWVALYDQGIAALPGATPAPESARAWRELYAAPLALALALFMLAGLPARALPMLLLVPLFGLAPAGPVWAASDESAEQERLAWRSYRAGNYPEALNRYARLGGYDGFMGAGAAAWRLKDYSAARRHFGAALMLSRGATQRADALYNLGNAHYGLGGWQAAVEAYRAVLLERPQDQRARDNLFQAERQWARRRQAVAPHRGDLYGRRGMLVQGEANLDWERESVVEEFEPEPAGARVGAAQPAGGAQLSEALLAARRVELDARRLQSGLRKLQLIEDRPRGLLRGMLKQDAAPASAELAPW
jgi:Ca-activated chloride channel family protein